MWSGYMYIRILHEMWSLAQIQIRRRWGYSPVPHKNGIHRKVYKLHNFTHHHFCTGQHKYLKPHISNDMLNLCRVTRQNQI